MPGTPLGRLCSPSPDMPAAIAPEVTTRYSFSAEVELINHGAEQVRVDLAAGSDQAGADFDDNSHMILNFAAWLEWYRI